MTREDLLRLVASEIDDRRVVEAFRDIDRALFVPEELVDEAYADHPIPIPEDQVTSQPTLIARMVAAASISPGDRVLEVGAGYGFQSAILAHLARKVWAIERHASLAQAARRNLQAASIDGADVVVGDGSRGLAERAPFDAIVVAAAADSVPAALVEQLREGGRLVIPIKRYFGDDVYLFEKRGGRAVKVRLVSPARFVPLISEVT
jgi:protein-L-isoaspartate(D-aspartate) O-methyltransferase